MLLTTTDYPNGLTSALEREAAKHRNGDGVDTHTPAQGRPRLPFAPPEMDDAEPAAEKPILALFCYEEAGSDVTRFIGDIAGPLSARGVGLHIYARKGFELDAPGALLHLLGDGGQGSLLDRVQEFTRRACNAFLKQSQTCPAPVTLMGFEWSAVPALSLLHSIKNLGAILSLHSVERQRSDPSGDDSQHIEEIELSGLRAARTVLTHDEAAANVLRDWAPEFAGRVVAARPMFPVDDFRGPIDSAVVKASSNIGPADPLILYVGDLDERYGPDLLMKSMPAVLKKHNQARLVVVGDGSLLWPLRVYARYLLLEHAVRLAGHIEGSALHELVQAADVVVVPSRDSTPWWPIQAAWAARRPVVATHEAAPALLEHEQDSVLIYPETASCAWGIDRVLADPDLAQAVAGRGHQKLKERFGWDAVAAQIVEAMGAASPRPF
jgi:glycosyltransferase involved in cell wall biosynthesis